MQLHDRQGKRLYLTAAERAAFMASSAMTEPSAWKTSTNLRRTWAMQAT